MLQMEHFLMMCDGADDEPHGQKVLIRKLPVPLQDLVADRIAPPISFDCVGVERQPDVAASEKVRDIVLRHPAPLAARRGPKIEHP